MSTAEQIYEIDTSGWADIRSEPMIVTPEMAQEWIDYTEEHQSMVENARQRALGKHSINLYSGQMSAGRWLLNGEAIVIDKDGLVMDGYHRLHSIVKGGVPIASMVTTGIDRSSFDSVNTGQSRQGRHVLQIAGVNERTGDLEMAIKWVIKLEEYNPETSKRLTTRTVTNHEVLAWYRKNPNMEKTVDYIAEIGTRKLTRVGIMAACHYLMARKDAELADAYCSAVLQGTGLPGRPALKIHTRLTRAKDSHVHRLTGQYQAALIIKGWNYTRAGLNPERIGWRGYGKGPDREYFPVVQ